MFGGGGGGGGGGSYPGPQPSESARGPGEGPGASPRSDCPNDFRAEVQDIDPDDWDWAARLPPGTLLEIVLADDDPQFSNAGRAVGWLSTNRDGVAACIAAGWTYTAEVIEVTPTAAGPLIVTRVQGAGP
jgi:hypothetical protein